MPRSFNVAGPCRPERHYMLPPLARLPEARTLAEEGFYFGLHAPRQTGKTTLLRTLAAELTASGRFAAVAASCEAGSAAHEDYAAAQRAILADLRSRAEQALPPDLLPPPWPDADALGLLSVALRAWAESCPRPLVLFLDEIDSLEGASLEAVLRQLRAAYDSRPRHAPASVILCGMRDVRDYKRASGGGPVRVGSASPFNVKVKSLRLANFSPAEVAALYAQHTADTGQVFTSEAVAAAVESTGGQPWLVNALAREIVVEMAVPPAEPITADHVAAARERLIRARATHLDSLAARLAEPRVRRVIEPMLAGTVVDTGLGYDDDVEYAHDLGLITRTGFLDIANPIYREVIARVLGASVEDQIRPVSYALPSGRLSMKKLLDGFVAFWDEQGEALLGPLPYHEVAPQLVLMAFLQKIVNGGGFIDREYGLGRKRIDLLVRWPYVDADGQRAVQREALELKVWRAGEKDPEKQGLAQLDAYLEGLGLRAGTLVIFDRRPRGKGARKPKRAAAKTSSGRAVTVLRMLGGPRRSAQQLPQHCGGDARAPGPPVGERHGEVILLAERRPPGIPAPPRPGEPPLRQGVDHLCTEEDAVGGGLDVLPAWGGRHRLGERARWPAGRRRWMVEDWPPTIAGRRATEEPVAREALLDAGYALRAGVVAGWARGLERAVGKELEHEPSTGVLALHVQRIRGLPLARDRGDDVLERMHDVAVRQARGGHPDAPALAELPPGREDAVELRRRRAGGRGRRSAQRRQRRRRRGHRRRCGRGRVAAAGGREQGRQAGEALHRRPPASRAWSRRWPARRFTGGPRRLARGAGGGRGISYVDVAM
jgi:hypothetical protein